MAQSISDEEVVRQHNDMYDDLASAVGIGISAFALLEVHLATLFATCLGLPTNVTARMLMPVKTFSLMLDMLDVVARHKIGSLGALPYWLTLLEYIRELSGDRNFIAHTPIVVHHATSEERELGDIGGPLLGPDLRAFMAGEVKRNPIEVAEVREVAEDFTHAGNLVQVLQRAIVNSSLETLSRPIERRRPPRAIRQGAALQGSKPQP
jgi:hypothetical protein